MKAIAAACSCVGDPTAPLCQKIEGIAVAFTGTVVEAGPPVGRERAPAWYRVRVDDRLLGVNAAFDHIVIDPVAESSCLTMYTEGDRYLFYGGSFRGVRPGWPDAPALTTNECNWGRGLARAQGDVAFLRQYAKEPQPARIFGAVQSHGNEMAMTDGMFPPLANALLRISGPDGLLTGRTDAQGRFHFEGVSPRQYTLAATLPGYRTKRPYTITVPKNGCGTAYVAMYTGGVVSGTVLNADGRPAAGAEVEVQHADRARYPLSIQLTTVRSDVNGRFTLTEVPAGDLVVGVNTRSDQSLKHRMLPTWWPGVTDREKARVLHLKPNERRSGLVIRLGKPAATRQVRIRVVHPDGTPATDVKVGAGPHWAQAVNAEGVVELELLSGTSYTVRAESGVRGVAVGRAELGRTETEITVAMSR